MKGRKTREPIIAEAIGTEIKRYRGAALLTQAELAEKIGIERQMVSVFERGVSVPNAVQIVRIADALNVKVEDIVKL